MKKLLLASTALVGTAGVAAADVAITGYAEIGIVGGDVYETDQWHTDIDVTFSMTGESDGGLAFGAIIDLDEVDGEAAFGGTTNDGDVYFLSFGGLRLDMGDTDGAFDAALQEVNVAGASIADDETAHAGFSGNGGFDLDSEQIGMGLDGGFDGQIARVSYAMSGFSAHLSAEIDDTGDADPIWGLGLTYDTDFGGTAVGFGLGYQTQEDIGDLIGVSVDATLANGFAAAVNYSELDFDDGDDLTHMAIGVGYTVNALAVGVNYGQYQIDGDEVSSGFGLAATYDLGGGLAAHFGYGNSSLDDDFATAIGSDDEFDSYSLGLSMSF